MEEAPENGKESPHSAHANGFIDWCYVVAGFERISADHAILKTEVHQNSFYQAEILTSVVWTVIVNLDFSSYKQAITKLRDDLLYIQKFKTPLAPVHELNHICYVLQKLGDK
jgi:hypothetical protein